jgi:hypothetical protein
MVKRLLCMIKLRLKEIWNMSLNKIYKKLCLFMEYHTGIKEVLRLVLMCLIWENFYKNKKYLTLVLIIQTQGLVLYLYKQKTWLSVRLIIINIKSLKKLEWMDFSWNLFSIIII